MPVVEDASFLNLGVNHVPEIIKDLPEGHSIMNESGMTTDSAGRPIIANWWADNAATGDGTWRNLGTWPMNETRRFWQLQRTEEATNDL
ncbi:MAG: BNR repeat-containing protein [Akkermansiaceae bacterium]|jgi:hypothetical protein|nr:BNR repeat-containing protein [Akkermansiaceae bacterium]